MATFALVASSEAVDVVEAPQVQVLCDSTVDWLSDCLTIAIYVLRSGLPLWLLNVYLSLGL